jgi:hypothetical protein
MGSGITISGKFAVMVKPSVVEKIVSVHRCLIPAEATKGIRS